MQVHHHRRDAAFCTVSPMQGALPGLLLLFLSTCACSLRLYPYLSPTRCFRIASYESLLEKLTAECLSNERLVKIVNLETRDEDCNTLCWRCLGYTYNTTTGSYSNEGVFPKWRERYPAPPDVIGVTRNYSAEVDKPVRDASMALLRSIPRTYKGGVRALEKEGFTGYKLNELTPNKTRRAQLVNWLLFYRDKLFNKTIDELREARLVENTAAGAAATPARLPTSSRIEGEGDRNSDATMPPSERNYQKSRLD